MNAQSPDPRKRLDGYVTTFRSVSGRSSAQLEQALGFAPGALTSGYLVYALAEPVGPKDFEWKDQTTYSDGWHLDRTIGEYVQRTDELRWSLHKRNNFAEPATENELRTIMARHVTRLNVRQGIERIVKVQAKGRIPAFPNSPLRGVPQWRLCSPKLFILLADVGLGGAIA